MDPNILCSQSKLGLVESSSAQESGYASATHLSRYVSERTSQIASRAASPPPAVRCADPDEPKLNIKFNDIDIEVSKDQAKFLLSTLADEETRAAEKWINELSWNSFHKYTTVQDKISAIEETIAKNFGIQEVDKMMSSVSDDVLTADLMFSMVDRAWDLLDDDLCVIEDKNDVSYISSSSADTSSSSSDRIVNGVNELHLDAQNDSSNNNDAGEVSSGIPMQVHKRSSKPQREDAVFNIRYKTQTCLHYDRTGKCPASENCHFAHGPLELRKPKNHPKFRTEPCKHFMDTGKCIYGKKCFFLHEDKPLTLRARRRMEKTLRSSSKVRSITNKYATHTSV